MTISYPSYYTMRKCGGSSFIGEGMECDEDEVILFIKIKNYENDNGFPVELIDFLKINFKFERITEAEAQSYELFGIAPVITPTDFTDWLVKQIDAGQFICRI